MGSSGFTTRPTNGSGATMGVLLVRCAGTLADSEDRPGSNKTRCTLRFFSARGCVRQHPGPEAALVLINDSSITTVSLLFRKLMCLT